MDPIIHHIETWWEADVRLRDEISRFEQNSEFVLSIHRVKTRLKIDVCRHVETFER